jgi:hypothetical protein
MKKHLLIGLMAGLASLLAEEAGIGFQGSLPAETRWINSGSLPVKSADINGVQALAFVDESSSGSMLLQYPIDKVLQAEMLSQGYTIDIRFKHLMDLPGNGNFSFTLRLPGVRTVKVTPWGNESKKTLEVTIWDNESQKNQAATIPYTDGFVNLGIVFRPASAGGEAKLELQLEGADPIQTTIERDERASQSVIELGGYERSPERMGSTYVESFKLSVP